MANDNRSGEQRKWNGLRNLVPFKSGAEWNGNLGGRPKGFRRLLRELMTKRELCGQPIPGGRTVEEALAEAAIMHALKGNPSILAQVLDRYDGPASQAALEAAIGRVTFEIISNGRDDPAPELGNDGKDGEQGEIDASNVPDKQAE